MEKVIGRSLVCIHHMKERKCAVWYKSALVISLGTSLNSWIHKIHRFPKSGMVTSNKEQKKKNFIRLFMLTQCLNLPIESKDLRLCRK